jgi:hypothetical protein
VKKVSNRCDYEGVVERKCGLFSFASFVSMYMINQICHFKTMNPCSFIG